MRKHYGYISLVLICIGGVIAWAGLRRFSPPQPVVASFYLCSDMDGDDLIHPTDPVPGGSQFYAVVRVEPSDSVDRWRFGYETLGSSTPELQFSIWHSTSERFDGTVGPFVVDSEFVHLFVEAPGRRMLCYEMRGVDNHMNPSNPLNP